MSLRWRLALWYLALLSLTLVVFSAVLSWNLERALAHQIDRDLESQTGTLQDSLEYEDGSFAPKFQHAQPGYVLFWFDPTWHLSQTTHPNLAALADPRARGLNSLEVQGQHWRRFTKDFAYQGKPAGHLQILRSLEPLRSSLAQLRVIFLVAIPLTLAVSVWGVLWLAKRALQPLSEVTRTAAQLGADDLSLRLAEPKVRDELGRLVETFNAMLGRLEDAFLRQKQFTSDAAHELRTPVSLIAARAELSLAQARPIREYQEALQEIVSESGHLSRLLSKLLRLARAESGSDILQKERLDLGDLAQDVITSLEGAAQAGQLRLDLECTGPAVTQGDQTRLVELLLNLAENAIHFSPPGGSVRLVVERLPQSIEVRVLDEGPGIPVDQRERIFERFCQLESARSRDGRESCGLGLAICRVIAQQHGGQVTCEGRQGPGSCFRLVLPIL